MAEGNPTQPKKSDLAVRTASAVVMIAVAGGALWLGGWVWAIFVAAVAVGVMWEWAGLVERFETSAVKRLLWLVGGAAYIGLGAMTLATLRTHASFGLLDVLVVVGMVIATDVGAYLVGRTVGGPKIAARISPSKTWSGLLGGILAASLARFLLSGFGCMAHDGPAPGWAECVAGSMEWQDGVFVLLVGTIVAVVAQFGDFFESWMKRRAGVKDSGQLIPGHGGLFDRVDGLLAVAFVLGVLNLIKDL